MTRFMSAEIDCLKLSGASDLWIENQSVLLEQVARDRPDLRLRYDRALAQRDAKEVERIWFECCVANREIHAALRINGVTGNVHFGHSARSVVLFPPAD